MQIVFIVALVALFGWFVGILTQSIIYDIQEQKRLQDNIDKATEEMMILLEMSDVDIEGLSGEEEFLARRTIAKKRLENKEKEEDKII